MWQILINMCNCLWSRKKMYRIRCLTGLCVLQESIWKRSKYWNHQQQQSKRDFFFPFSFLSCVSRLIINGLIGQSKVSSRALPAPNYFSWWWMSSSTVTGLRRNSTAISSTSPCIVLFFFSGVSNLTHEKSLSSRIARNHDAVRLRWNWYLFFLFKKLLSSKLKTCWAETTHTHWAFGWFSDKMCGSFRANHHSLT